MPPKRWGAKQTAISSERALALLKDYITREVGNNNGLGLPEREMECMANELIGAKTRAEVFEWCKTLMLEESVAAEIVKRREDGGPCFAGEEGENADKGFLGQPIPTVTEAMQKSASRNVGAPTGHATTTDRAHDGNPSVCKGRRNKAHGSVSVQPGKNKPTKFGHSRELRMDQTDSAAVLKPGRFECGCFATVHALRGSCRNCGRIICEQEDDTVCYFCNMDPRRCVAYEIEVEEGRVDAAAMARDRAQYEAALAQRDKLLAYAQQRAKRTTVIDDQADSLLHPNAGGGARRTGGVLPARLTQSAAASAAAAPLPAKFDMWLSPEERAEAEERAEQQRQVALLHRRRGAYQVQVDLFGSAVPLVVSKGQPMHVDMRNECGAADATEPTTGNYHDEEEGGESACDADGQRGRVGGDGVNRERSPAHRDAALREGDEDTSAGSGARPSQSVASLSRRMKAIWYDTVKEDSAVLDEDYPLPAAAMPRIRMTADPLVVPTQGSARDGVVLPRASSAAMKKTTSVTPAGGGGGAKGSRAKAHPREGEPEPEEEVSCRVQQDYYHDDWSTYASAARDEEGPLEELVFLPHVLDDDDDDGEGKSGSNRHDTENVDEDDTAAAECDENGRAKAGGASGAGVAAGYSVCTVPTRLMRARDEGVCLSMHQPWASLLVAGIKKHEGRGWSTSYRGRLWIHAASVTPTVVAETEEHYSAFMSPAQSFPTHYPTRVLLGYVYLTDCLDRETYESAYAPSERQENSPFTFICVEPRMLPFPLPMSGNHKLFTLERRVHTAAKKQLSEIS